MIGGLLEKCPFLCTMLQYILPFSYLFIMYKKKKTPYIFITFVTYVFFFIHLTMNI